MGSFTSKILTSLSTRRTSQSTLSEEKNALLHSGKSPSPSSAHSLLDEVKLGQTTYKCTVCKMPFIDKDLWKRHETGGHYQTEGWACVICGLVFAKVELWKAHNVDMDHPLPTEYTEQSRNGETLSWKDQNVDIDHPLLGEFMEQSHIGKNFSKRIWCGFCYKVILLTKKHNEGWDERSDHVGKHFQEGKEIENWVELQAVP